MKKFFIAVGLPLLSLCATAQDRYMIKGHLSGLKEGKVLLMGIDHKTPLDSTFLKDGYFTFKGIADADFMQKGYYSVKEVQNLPVSSAIKIIPLKEEKLQGHPFKGSSELQAFYLEKGLTEVTGDHLNTALIKSGKTQAEYNLLMAAVQPLQDKQGRDMEALSHRPKDDTTSQKELLRQWNDMYWKSLGEIREQKIKFLKEHPKSYVSLDIVGELGGIIDPVTFPAFFNMLDPSLQNTAKGKRLVSRLEIAKRTAVGQQIMDFTQNDTSGNPVTLTSFRGNYVLIDFWASWCGPCRAENPNVVKAYQKFKDKNFQIVSVSLDSKKEPWIAAINKDGMPWIHVSDLQGWANTVAVQYGVKAVPQNFLIDPKGIIIGINLRGEELSGELQKLIIGK